MRDAKVPARKRRPTAEIRSLVLASARLLFAERGYAATSTRSIAEHAGVAEHLIFRHFGSKGDLFQQAVFLPLDDQFTAYEQQWRARQPSVSGMLERARFFITTLYDHLRENRGLLRAYLMSAPNGDLDPHHASNATGSPIARYLDRLAAPAGQSLVEIGWNLPNPTITVRMTFGLVFMNAVFDDLLYGPGRTPTREEIIEEMTAYLIHGIDRRGAGQEPS